MLRCWLFTCLLVAACGKEEGAPPAVPKGESFAEVLEAHGTEAARRVEAIEKLKGALGAAKAEGRLPGDARFLLSGLAVKSSQNAVLLYDDELDGEPTKHFAAIVTYPDPGDTSKTPLRFAAHNGCKHFAKQLANAKDPTFKTKRIHHTNRQKYEACGKLQYAVVIKVTKETKPVLGAKDAAGKTSFQSGAIEADILAFELPSGKFLGGAKAAAVNSDNLSADKFQLAPLEADLRFRFYQKVKEVLPSVPDTPDK